MIRAILIVLAMLIFIFLMMKKILPTIVALPLLAVTIGLLAGIPWSGEEGILTTIIENGFVRMQGSVMVVIIGGWMGEVFSQSGAAKKLIKSAAELGGNNPLLITLLLAAASALVFTSFGGLNGAIVVGTISLPIMMSLGYSAVSAGSIMLLSIAIGIAINVGNWQFYADSTGVSTNIVQTYAFICSAVTAVAAIALIVLETRKLKGVDVKQWAAEKREEDGSDISWLACLTPLIPLLLVVVFKLPIRFAMTIAAIYNLLFCFKGRSFSEVVNFCSKTMMDGAVAGGKMAFLLGGIGMIITAAMNGTTAAAMKPLLEVIIPSNKIGYIIFFILLAPLALYRGPFNLYGLGSGILAMIVGAGLLSPNLAMSGLLALERVQAISDPTNSFTVWIANFVGVSVNDLMKKTLPFSWGVAAVLIIVSSILYS